MGQVPLVILSAENGHDLTTKKGLFGENSAPSPKNALVPSGSSRLTAISTG